jgi:hypothetical protein
VPLGFAGYGIVAPELDYNDYQGLGVTGRVVVVLTGEPDSADPEYFAGASSGLAPRWVAFRWRSRPRVDETWEGKPVRLRS